ncbi:MAG TPA: Gfo/Idh/MocA family oxidoreductase [Candidatus Hydrogenedentes bacterium]|nr:Gfo/Idh/MocA family oxidoreductase [Candidatus Hydrogenedentota bacterium]
MNGVNRRDFVKCAGAAAGFAVTAGVSPFTYAQNSRVVVGCVGVGGQGCFHLRVGLAGTPDIHIAAVCDVWAPSQKAAMPLARLANAKQQLAEGEKPTADQIAAAEALPKPNVYYDYREMLEKETLDGVIIASPLLTHAPITLAALDAGKYVFCEKTLVSTVEEGRAVVTKCHDTRKWVQVGHQRRYNPKYNLAMGLVYDKGTIGRVTHITAQWHRNSQWRRPTPSDYVLNDEEKKFITDLEKHTNWRIYADCSGGLYTELATHQTDIANWFLKAVPSRVYSSAGLDYWKDGRTTDDNIGMMYEYDIRRGDPGFIQIKSPTTLMDDSLANRSYTVRFQYSSILSNAKRGCRELIEGNLGTLDLSEEDCVFYHEADCVRYRERVSAEELSKKTPSLRTPRPEWLAALKEGYPLMADQTGLLDPDAYQFQAFAEGVRTGKPPRNNQMVGFTTAITAIAAIQSRTEGRPVTIDPAWHTFDFEVPSFYDHDASWVQQAQPLIGAL